MIVQIISILLLFLTEAEAYCCMKSMVEISKHYLKTKRHHSHKEDDDIDIKQMRWYFTFDSQQFMQLSHVFFEEVKAKHDGFSQILKHFTKIQFKYMKLFQEWTKSLYLIHLPLPVNIFFFSNIIIKIIIFFK